MKAIGMLMVLLSVGGCSHRAVYENIQINNRNDCSKRPPSEYAACMERASKSYDEYERERQEIIK
ncbi:hypothetical protein [Marinobacter caseinilyticus]|uniref:hypothetical protein n=1 Tax=Marinobacter caseinilyticus TaxID=2692195 RepID=UPI001F37300A|nr:hypothetical protein [Marinobacter caseinilyticus]